MTGAVVVPPGGGELVGDSPERRVEILSDHETLNATWTRYGPRREGADLHVHREHTDLFYVLTGELTVRLGLEDEAVAVSAGTLVRVPPFVVHGFRNAGAGELRYLNLHAPGRRFADFLRAARDGRSFDYDQFPPPAGGDVRPAGEAVVGGGEVVVDRDGHRVEVLADVDRIGVAETWSEPGGLDVPAHVHLRHLESLYVLEGELALTAGGRSFRAPAGSWIDVPQGVPHSLAVAGGEPARFLDVHTPSCGLGAFDQVPA